MNLYKLAENYNCVMQMIEDDETDATTLTDTLESIEASIEVKASNIVYLVKNLDAYSVGIETEIKRLQAKQKAVQAKQDSIKEFLFTQLESMGMTEIKTNIATIKKVNNPPSVSIADESVIPAKYLTIVPESYKISKTEIAKDLKAGVEVPGATLQTSRRWKIS